jgi:hypothetical protein
LPLVPASPKLGPVFFPVTHLVPAKFPILVIIPAIALDLRQFFKPASGLRLFTGLCWAAVYGSIGSWIGLRFGIG